MAFQTSINSQPAPAIEGDFCSANPRGSLLSGDGGFISGPLGLTAGKFAWADASGVARAYGGVGRLGFVHRDNLSLQTTWLARSSMSILPNVEVVLHAAGDFWMRFAAGALPGQKVFASFADGSPVAGTAGSPPADGSATGTIAAGSASITASIAPSNPVDGSEPGGIMTVTAVGSGTIQIGAMLAGTGVVSGSQILSQLSGTKGGVGKYVVNYAQTVASTTVTASYGLFTAASGLTGSFAIGDILGGGAGPAAGTTITDFGTATGGLGTYIVNLTQTVSSGAFTSVGAVETPWTVQTYAAAGELAKTSTQRLT